MYANNSRYVRDKICIKNFKMSGTAPTPTPTPGYVVVN